MTAHRMKPDNNRKKRPRKKNQGEPMDSVPPPPMIMSLATLSFTIEFLSCLVILRSKSLSELHR